MGMITINDYYTYMLKCKDGTLYTGSTNNIENRLVKHRQGKGAKYTRGRLPVELVYLEKCENKSNALKREIEIKKLTKMQKEALIKEGDIDVDSKKL